MDISVYKEAERLYSFIESVSIFIKDRCKEFDGNNITEDIIRKAVEVEINKMLNTGTSFSLLLGIISNADKVDNSDFTSQLINHITKTVWRIYSDKFEKFSKI